VVFKLTPTASGPWKERVLYPFLGENENDGYSPEQTLVFDTAGNLYGTTYLGGGHSNCGTFTCGIVFKLTSRKSGYWAEHILHRFDGGAGGAGRPTGPLILDSAGNLYGTTIGTAFKITPDMRAVPGVGLRTVAPSLIFCVHHSHRGCPIFAALFAAKVGFSSGKSGDFRMPEVERIGCDRSRLRFNL
jgi:hypothetical protein